MRILVSGIASDIGFNCGRILRELGGVETLFGVDIHTDHAGLGLFDDCFTSPHANEPGYESWLLDFLERHEIDVFLPTSEAEIARISSEDLSARTKTSFMIANRQVVDNSLDKYHSLTHLAKAGIRTPANGIVGATDPCFWPVVVKPRSGQGSKGVMIVYDVDEYRRATSGYVWQALLLPEDQEYTCPVFRSPSSGTRILIMRRTLQGGLTGRGEVVDDPEIIDYVKDIATVLDLHGAMNVQLRRTDTGPVLFEINPRLSSTVMFRHRMGFEDLRWWLMELIGCGNADYAPVASGTRFYRGSQEYIVQPN